MKTPGCPHRKKNKATEWQSIFSMRVYNSREGSKYFFFIRRNTVGLLDTVREKRVTESKLECVYDYFLFAI
jgi:hypothetical protein